MRKEGLTQVRAADVLGIAQAEVSMYLNGRTPSLERALRFEKATGGAIRPMDWVTKEARS